MDATERIHQLMQERGLSMYMLSKLAGLSPNTLQNMFMRHTQPSVQTIEAICHGLGLTMAQFFQEGPETVLTPDQNKLLRAWSLLSEKKQAALLEVIRLMNDNLYN